MDFSFSDDEKTVAELARKILSEKVTPERLKDFELSEAAIDTEV